MGRIEIRKDVSEVPRHPLAHMLKTTRDGSHIAQKTYHAILLALDLSYNTEGPLSDLLQYLVLVCLPLRCHLDFRLMSRLARPGP